MKGRAVGKVYLVGAGPGDPGLFTLKGKECLARADTVLYDRLISPRLLEFAAPGAELIFAGKSPERHTLEQEEINKLLVEKALSGRTVVRLKGGDPFLFGRGGEEALTLAEQGIPFEVVPGVSSALAVPAYAGIPVTHRDYTSSLTIAAGNEEKDQEGTGLDWEKLATGAGTLVFLMGMKNLSGIRRKLLEHGRRPETPVALVRWGTRPEQRTLVGTLADIEEKASLSGFRHPVIIVVGEVVGLRERLNWFERRPLFGRRVLVTRPREQAASFVSLLEERGAEVWPFPTIAVAPPEDYAPLDRALGEIRSYRWVVFTSANGVDYFFQRMRALGMDLRELYGVGLCAIGPKTAGALERLGLRVEVLPEEFVAESLAGRLGREKLAGQRVLLARADIARKVLPEMLRGLGALVEEVTAYRTVPPAGADGLALRRALGEGRIDVLTFTSSSTVKNFASLLGGADLPSLLRGAVVACIGPITSATARELGLAVEVEAANYTVEGLTEALCAYYAEKPS